MYLLFIFALYLISVFSTTITFSGEIFNIRNTTERAGPGNNIFDGSLVTLNSNGSLTLNIKQFPDGTWRCSEVWSVKSFGYGTYEFEVEPFPDLDPNIVVGLFTYLDDRNEIDIEFAKWGYPESQNAWYVVQPSSPGRYDGFFLPSKYEKTIHRFTWERKSVFFESLTSNGEVIYQWEYSGNRIPKQRNEKVHMNLWLFSGPPTNGKDVSITISSFKYIR